MFWRWASLTCIAGLAAFAACGVDNVDTRSFDRSCTADDDCVLVRELIARGADCAISCPRNGINKSGLAAYDTKLEDERGGCRSTSEPSCVAQTPACRSGICVAIGEDGGAS